MGWSFVDHEESVERLRDRETRLLHVIAQSSRLRRLFHREGAWREAGVVSYEGEAQEFLRRLCTLIHISGGQPVREPELFSMTWLNTQSGRGITPRAWICRSFSAHHQIFWNKTMVQKNLSF